MNQDDQSKEDIKDQNIEFIQDELRKYPGFHPSMVALAIIGGTITGLLLLFSPASLPALIEAEKVEPLIAYILSNSLIMVHTVMFTYMAMIPIAEMKAQPHIDKAKQQTDNFTKPLPEGTLMTNEKQRNQLTMVLVGISIIAAYALFFNPSIVSKLNETAYTVTTTAMRLKQGYPIVLYTIAATILINIPQQKIVIESLIMNQIRKTQKQLD